MASISAAPTQPSPKPGVAPPAAKPSPATIPGAVSAKTVDPSKKTGSIATIAPFRIEPLQDSTHWLKLLVYGVHGAGKTLIGGTAADVPDMSNVLVIDAEGGTSTLKDTDRIVHKENITKIRVTDYKSVAQIHDWLKAHCHARDKGDTETLRKLEAAVTGKPIAEVAEPRVYRTVVLDSLTEIEQYSVYNVMGIDQDNIIQDDLEVAGWPEFRKNFESVKLLIRAYRDLPMHTIFTCAVTYKQDEKKRFHYQPLLTGQLSRSAQGFVGMVGFLVMDQPKADEEAPRRMFVQPIQISEGKFDAKNRYAQYKGSYFDDPTMAQIMKAIGMTT